MEIEIIILFIFGTILGSFLNALSFRHNTGKGMGGRSQCFSCGTMLTARDLVPVLSYVFLGGRCRTCKSEISIQYPLVEIIAGGIAILCWYSTATPVQFILSLAFFTLLLFIAIYDIRHTIIPDEYVFGAGYVALLYQTFSGSFPAVPSLDVFLAGPLLALPLFLIWLVSKGRWMGLGDAKLMLACGLFLGLFPGIAAFMLAFWIGAIVSVSFMLAQNLMHGKNQVKMNSEIPFGPYLVLGVAVSYFAHVDVLSILTFFA